HEVVPVRNDVAERTPLVTERNAAIHAPRGLLLEVLDRVGQVDLAPVTQALVDRTRGRLLPVDLEKAGDFAHERPIRWSCPPAPRTWARVPRRAPGLPPRALSCSPSA